MKTILLSAYSPDHKIAQVFTFNFSYVLWFHGLIIVCGHMITKIYGCVLSKSTKFSTLRAALFSRSCGENHLSSLVKYANELFAQVLIE